MKKYFSALPRNARKIIFGVVGVFTACCCAIGIASSVDTPSTQTQEVGAVFTSAAETVIAQSIQTQADQKPIPEYTPTEFVTQTQLPLSSATIQPSIVTSSASCIPNNPAQTGKVVDVVDGDTIKVLLDQDGQTYSVRYIGMDTPENTSQIEYFGAEASAKNTELVYGKTVTLIKDVSETDRYNRLLRYVLVGDTFVNYELVNQGYATAVDYPPDISCSTLFHETEYKAKSILVGLWATQNLLPTQPLTSTTLVIVSVNKQTEYADIRNDTGTPIDLSGWVLVSEKGNQSCSLGGVIQPGELLRIWAGSEQTGFSCNIQTNIWNNSELDPAVLYNPEGQEVSRYPSK